MHDPAQPILCYVTDRSAFAGDDAARVQAVLRCARDAAAAAVDWIQIREKKLGTRALLALAEQAEETAGGSTRILVNDRLDVALAAGAGGVHLGGSSIPVRAVVEWLAQGSNREGGHGFSRAEENPAWNGALAPEEDFLVGASCHSLAEAQAAAGDGANYIFFGPVFATPSKAAYGQAQGVEKLAEVCRGVRIPVLAIGGITLENAVDCLRAGAAGIAAIRLFQDSTDLAATVRALRARHPRE